MKIEEVCKHCSAPLQIGYDFNLDKQEYQTSLYCPNCGDFTTETVYQCDKNESIIEI